MQRMINEADDGPQNWSSGDDGESFEGNPIKIRVGATGRRERLEFLYGGLGSPDGTGHGHVICNDGENASYFRNDDGTVVVNDAAEDPYSSIWEPH